MAFPAYNGSINQLDEVLTRVRSLAHNIKSNSQSLRDDSAAGSIPARRVLLYLDAMSQVNAQLNTLKAVPGLAAYAKTQYNSDTFDIAAEFAAMQGALTTVINWIVANIPKDAGGRWLAIEEIVNGLRVDRMLTTAATATMRSNLDALIATID